MIVNEDEEAKRKKEKTSKIIITVSVIIIFVLVAFFIAFIVIKGNAELAKRKTLENNTKETSNVTVENNEEEQISNEKIVNNPNEELNKSFGKVEIVWLDAQNNITEEPAKPVLSGMTPVKYNQFNLSFEKTTSDDADWYNYSNRIWANAVDTNSSYFVWIPRYAYKIVYYSDSSYSKIIGYSDARGILKVTDDKNTLTRIQAKNTGLREVGNHYILAPAFMKDTASGFNNGGWDINISGFWCAKYEMSMEVNGVHMETDDTTSGNVTVSNIVKAVSKPPVSSWRNISIGLAYNNAFNYNRTLESHMMKNSEWGAVAYLAYSVYGRDAYALEVNDSRDYLTGDSTVETEVYNTKIKQSTTGNATGIHDLAGGASEFVSSFINNGYSRLQEFGGTGEDYLLETASSNKYKTVYSNASSDDGKSRYSQTFALQNFDANRLRRGDAIYETSINGFGSTSWNINSSFYVQQDIPFFVRGGAYTGETSAGLFNYNGASGQADASDSFRVVLVTE